MKARTGGGRRDDTCNHGLSRSWNEEVGGKKKSESIGNGIAKWLRLYCVLVYDRTVTLPLLFFQQSTSSTPSVRANAFFWRERALPRTQTTRQSRDMPVHASQNDVDF